MSNSIVRFYRLFISSIVVCSSLLEVRSAQLAAVPMQGGMIMPMIRYDSAKSRLTVSVPADIAHLTPLLISNPGDDFLPGDPWYPLLSPSGESGSFSRRYGFVMDAESDLLPENQAIWIRKVSSTAGLSIYRYASGESKAFEPVFGTGGTLNALRWNGMMFHPTFTAKPGTNEHAAEFEAYLADIETGEELDGSSTGVFTLRWTNQTDGRPDLRIEAPGVVSWPASTVGYVLEATKTLGQPFSVVATENASLAGDRWRLPLDATEPQSFYRMRLTR